MARNLTSKQTKFVEAITDPTNKTQYEAAIKAGYTPKHADEAACEVLRNPKILAAIEERKAEMRQYANIDAGLVLGGTAQRASASLDDALDEHGRFDIEKARQTGVIHQIKRISRTPNKYGETVSIELYGKDQAQDKLGSYLGLEQLPKANDADNLSIAKKVVAELLAQGTDKDEAVEFVVGRYGVLADKVID